MYLRHISIYKNPEKEFTCNIKWLHYRILRKDSQLLRHFPWESKYHLWPLNSSLLLMPNDEVFDMEILLEELPLRLEQEAILFIHTAEICVTFMITSQFFILIISIKIGKNKWKMRDFYTIVSFQRKSYEYED